MKNISDDGTRTPDNIMRSKVAEARDVVREALSRTESGRGVVAYSGGKDSIAVALVALQEGVHVGVCEASFTFRQAEDNFRNVASDIGLDVAYWNRLDMSWVRRHPEILFTSDSRVRGWTFSVRQQETVKRFSRDGGYECQIFGRRLEENTVPSTVYITRSGVQCHPLRGWTLADVWTYLAQCGVAQPWVYGTEFGRAEGNAPFYTVRSEDVGGIVRAWSIVGGLDPRYTREEVLG